jgi:CheY-like chemotaxis protein
MWYAALLRLFAPRGQEDIMRVLIVEDEFLIALGASDTLEAAGYEIAAIVASVPAALKAIADISFDVALIDANLGGESAHLVAVALNQKAIPFVVMTGYSATQREGALANAPFLPKPYVESALVNAINGLCK